MFQIKTFIHFSEKSFDKSVTIFLRLGKPFKKFFEQFPQDGFFQKSLWKNPSRPVPDPVPRDGTGHGIVATLLSVQPWSSIMLLTLFYLSYACACMTDLDGCASELSESIKYLLILSAVLFLEMIVFAFNRFFLFLSNWLPGTIEIKEMDPRSNDGWTF